MLINLLVGTKKMMWLCVVGLLAAFTTMAQSYTALNGSAHAGSLAPSLNPAAIVRIPYAWDITPLAFQFKQATNIYRLEKFSLLSQSDEAVARAQNGTRKRFLMGDMDIRLLNARIKLTDNAAIAFGANLRLFTDGSSSTNNWQDTMFSLADFLRVNVGNTPLSAQNTSNAWAELYGTYSRLLWQDAYKSLYVGFTLRASRTLAAGFAAAGNVSYSRSATPTGKEIYLLNTGSIVYGYSANIDAASNAADTVDGFKAFMQNGRWSPGADVGIEYVIRSTQEEFDDDEYAYNLKIGVSVLDIGSNRYSHSAKGRFATAGKPNINDTIIEAKFRSVNSLDDFNDSLATVAGSIVPQQGDFVVYHPTRLLINADKRIQENIYVNAALSLPLVALAPEGTLRTRDVNLLTVTARWEKKSLGLYLPVMVNLQRQTWVGAAFKAGPLLLGTHNLANIFARNKIQAGGLYLAFTIRPGNPKEKPYSQREKQSRDQRRKQQCPAF
jgi:hypothetical protein